MQTNIINLKKAIYKWLAENSQIQFIYANQNGPDPVVQFATYQIINTKNIGQDIVTYQYNPDDDVFNEKISGLRRVMVSLNVFREDGYIVLSNLLSSLSAANTVYNLYNSGLGFESASDIRNLTDIVSGNYENRFQLDVTFYIISEYNSSVDRIATLEIEKEFN